MPVFVMPFASPRGQAAFAALDTFTQGYIEALFWTETGTDDDARLRLATFESLATRSLASIEADCTGFQAQCAPALAAALAKDPSRTARVAGHDFWLTRNGHGAGFWDGSWPTPEAAVLDAAAKQAGECWISAYADGKIYVSR